MPPPLYIPRPHVLRFVRDDPPDELARFLEKHGLPLLRMPERPPESIEAFRGLTRQSLFALVDLDLGAPALAWLQALRAQRPGLPLVATFQSAGLGELLPAGAAGLDRVLRLPASAEEFARLLAPWLPAAPSAPAKPDSLATSVPFLRRAARLPARHLSPASDANQEILHTLEANPTARRFVVHGPEGAEFGLLALEIAARHGLNAGAILTDKRPLSRRPGFVLTRDTARLSAAGESPVLLVRDYPAGGEPSSGDAAEDLVSLHLKPLHRRLPDLACYVNRWLPVLTAANQPPRTVLPLPPAWRHALLAHPWQGEFAELWRVLLRLAHLPADAPPPAEFAPASGHGFDFDALLRRTAARAYRARLARRIPAGLLPAVMSALGCPETELENE